MYDYDLTRFYKAQENEYEQALAEIKNGYKEGHYMWYIFPQIRFLGYSENAIRYGIANIEEAQAYVNDDILGARLRELCEALLKLPTNDPVEIFGELDAMKLKSCMTLFKEASDDHEIFDAVLLKFFKGELDQLTLEKL